MTSRVWNEGDPEPAPETAPETTTEVVEYRVSATTPKGDRVDFTHSTSTGARRHARQYQDEWGWTDVRVESRTVRTWTSGWSPVPDDTGETQ